MTANSIPSIRISPETDGYQLPSLHYPPSNSETTNMRAIATPSISQSSEAFDPHPYNPLALEDFIITGMYDQPQKDDCDFPSSPFLPDDGSEATNSQPVSFDMECLGSELYTLRYISGPAGAQPIPAGTMDNAFLLPSPSSPPSSYHGSQSPASVYSELSSSDVEYTSPTSSVPPDESSMYHGSPYYAGHYGHPCSDHRHTSSESVATRDLILSPRVPGHHRSHSAPSISRGRIATQAMLDANARRRVHDAQFTCVECQQTFTAQFSLKRHQRSHTGERLFQCSIPGCGQKFFNSSDCKRHEKSKKRHPNLA